MKPFLTMALLASTLCSTFVLGGCTGREVATGAAAGAAGYIIGREDADD